MNEGLRGEKVDVVEKGSLRRRALPQGSGTRRGKEECEPGLRKRVRSDVSNVRLVETKENYLTSISGGSCWGEGPYIARKGRRESNPQPLPF